MYDNGFSDRLIRATMPTQKKNRETREKDLQSVYEKCRQGSECSFGEYIRCKISRDTLRKCGISNIDLRYIEVSAESQLYHGGTTWEAGKMYLFTGSIDRLSTSNHIAGKSQGDECGGVDCVRLFQLDKDRHLLAVNRSAIEELCRAWYNLASLSDEPSTHQRQTPIITINGHDGTNGNIEKEENREGEKKNGNTAKEENGKTEVNGVKEEASKSGENGKKEDPDKKDNIETEMHLKPFENGSQLKENKDEKKLTESEEELFIRLEGLSLIDVCFQNERESEFYNVEGIAYEDASSGSSKDILLYHTSASASISSKDILLFDTTDLRLKQELIVPRRSTKHLVRGQNGYLRCNEPARPRAPPSVRARPMSAGRSGENGTKSSWSAETSTRDTKL